MKKWVTIEKSVGETPLQALERFRTHSGLSSHIPLAYAGRLDPMASGTLLILIGEECKKQKAYHGLDKEYIFEALFGIRSDTGDVLGLPETCDHSDPAPARMHAVAEELVGNIELSYPRFSSKTVRGKPLFQWALENRLNEIEIPTKHSRIYKLTFKELKTIPRNDLQEMVHKKITTLPKVTEASKALGRDFRREEIKASWDEHFRNTQNIDVYTVATFSCITSSGTYMRTLAEVIAEKLGTCGLALSIHRTQIGKYTPIIGNLGVWRKRY